MKADEKIYFAVVALVKMFQKTMNYLYIHYADLVENFGCSAVDLPNFYKLIFIKKRKIKNRK